MGCGVEKSDDPIVFTLFAPVPGFVRPRVALTLSLSGKQESGRKEPLRCGVLLVFGQSLVQQDQRHRFRQGINLFLRHLRAH
jgi:hypothetical protein